MERTIETVLLPLSEATGQALRPLDLREGDNLFLWFPRNSDGRFFHAETYALDASGEVCYWPGRSDDATNWYSRIPEHEWLGEDKKADGLYDRYKLAATDLTALVIHHAWPKDRVHFRAGPKDTVVDDNARLTFELLIQRFLAQEQRSILQAEFKVNGRLPALSEHWVEHEELPLKDYQKAAVSMTAFQSASGLFMDRGTGKSPTTIQRICLEAREFHRRTGQMFRALIVCPPQVRRNWQDEVQRFAVTAGKTVIVKGPPVVRLKKLVHGVTPEPRHEYGIVIVGYHTLVASIDHFAKVPWDLVVLDESHWIKASSTMRWKAAKKLRELSRRRMILTGTPIGNSLMDLWAQLEFLGEGLSGFQNFRSFRNFHGEWEQLDPMQSGIERLLSVKNVPLLQERLARLTFSITKQEAGLNLPDKMPDVWEVNMTPKQTKLYEEVAKKLSIEIEDQLSGEVNHLTVGNILTKLLRLSQITSGFVVFDPIRDPDTNAIISERSLRQIDDVNPKLEAAVEMLTAEDRDPLGKTIIWCHWVEDIQALDRRLTAEGIEHVLYYGQVGQDARDAAEQRFNQDPTCRVFIANAQTAGEGLNLIGYDKTQPETSLTYTDHVIFFSQNWSSLLRGQAEDRAHRYGTRVPVRITDLVVLGTIDEEIRRRVRAKIEAAVTVMDIRHILAHVLRAERDG